MRCDRVAQRAVVRAPPRHGRLRYSSATGKTNQTRLAQVEAPGGASRPAALCDPAVRRSTLVVRHQIDRAEVGLRRQQLHQSFAVELGAGVIGGERAQRVQRVGLLVDGTQR